MRTNHLPHSGYLRFILKNRLLILIAVAVMVIVASFSINIEFSHQDQRLWINGSSAYNTLIENKYPSYCVEKIDVSIADEGWNAKTVAKLRAFEQRLRETSNVKEVHSLFESKQVENKKLSEYQQMVQVVSLDTSSDDEVVETIERMPESYEKYIDNDTVSFYVMSSEKNQFKDIDSPLKYTLTNKFSDQYFSQAILFVILMSILAILFTVVFKTFLPSILGAIFIYSTGVITVALFQLFSSVSITHISIILVAMTISVMDFSYIYYKWHFLQASSHPKHVLYRVVTKTIMPIFWTSVITVIGIGSLVFVESEILFSIGMNVAISAISGFILSFVMLPALFSYFHLDNAQITTRETAHFFANKEARYRKQWLRIFLAASLIVFFYALYNYVTKPIPVASSQNNHHIKAVLDRKGFDHEHLMELRWIETRLLEEFDSIEKISSAYTMIRSIHDQENPNEPFVLSEKDIDSYLFSIDLYGLKESLMEQGALVLHIDLKDNANKGDVLRFLKDKGLLFQDRSSLLNLAKIESISNLWFVVFLVLFLIVLVVYNMTKLRAFASIAFIVNAIPLVWFFSAIYFFDIALSMEILVAMIVTLALSSDATLHFIWFYYDKRHKPRTAELALELSFVYVGTPLVMGNIILGMTFGALALVPIETISNIGIYSSLLITLSLLTDMFILPVMFLSDIKSNQAIKDYNHSL
jgi:predicted RND superfamily exporter protein